MFPSHDTSYKQQERRSQTNTLQPAGHAFFEIHHSPLILGRRLVSVLNQRFGIELRHMTLHAEITARRNGLQLLVVTVQIVRLGHLGSTCLLRPLLRVTVHALVEVLRDVVALDAVRNQGRLFLEITRNVFLVLFGTERIDLEPLS